MTNNMTNNMTSMTNKNPIAKGVGIRKSIILFF